MSKLVIINCFFFFSVKLRTLWWDYFHKISKSETVFLKKIYFFNTIVRTCEMSFMKVSLFQIIKFKCVIQTFITSNCVFTSIIPSERYTYHMQQISKHFAGNIKTSSTMLFLYMCVFIEIAHVCTAFDVLKLNVWTYMIPKS